jgi:hypothetical protein
MRPSEDGRIEAESSSSKPENQQPKTCNESRPRTERAALQSALLNASDLLVCTGWRRDAPRSPQTSTPGSCNVALPDTRRGR